MTVTVVPRPGSLSNANVPFSWSTRSRILITPSPPDFPDLVGVATYTIIGHGKANATVGPGKPNLNFLCSRIFGGIAEGFLRDAVETQRGSR